jgi:hypothetical protein
MNPENEDKYAAVKFLIQCGVTPNNRPCIIEDCSGKMMWHEGNTYYQLILFNK